MTMANAGLQSIARLFEMLPRPQQADDRHEIEGGRSHGVIQAERRDDLC